jgi:hypothetical protein
VARPDRPGPDPFDTGLSAARNGVDDAAVGAVAWVGRTEPDSAARRAASDAIKAADRVIAAMHRFRAEMIAQVRRADDEAADRADQLLARTREGTTR